MKKNGVTLIELIIVMVIIAIGATFVVPAIGSWIPNYRLKGAARDIVSILRVAQMKAVSANMEYRVKFDQSAGSYILQYRTTAGGSWINDGEEKKLPSGIQIVDLEPDDFEAQFNPNSTSTAGSIILKNTKGTHRKITISSSTGKVNVE